MKGLADLLRKWLNEESCVDKNYDELQKMEGPKIYTMSETYESYTADDYMKQGDVGPYFDVVPLHDYLALRAKLAEFEDKLALAVEALADFKKHGTRHDTTPTGMVKECGCFDSFKGDNWQGYIKSQDEYVRLRAAEALKQIGEE